MISRRTKRNNEVHCLIRLASGFPGKFSLGIICTLSSSAHLFSYLITFRFSYVCLQFLASGIWLSSAVMLLLLCGRPKLKNTTHFTLNNLWRSSSSLPSMGEWVIGAVINLIGSIAINFGTNLLKLGHDEVLSNLYFDVPLYRTTALICFPFTPLFLHNLIKFRQMNNCLT